MVFQKCFCPDEGSDSCAANEYADCQQDNEKNVHNYLVVS